MSLLTGDLHLAAPYFSASQRARVVTEAWVAQNGYCLCCNSDRLRSTPRNTQARDFECETCSHPYELKSASSSFGRRVTDGAYASMMRRIQTATVPSFLLLQYSPTWHITNFSAIHHLFITPSVIEERKPLASTAKRAGWVGCNILLSCIPPEGRIPLISNGVPLPKHVSRKRFAMTERLSALSVHTRNWAGNLLTLLHKMNKTHFTIEDAYGFEHQLGALYPSNRHIRPKIRQQLQVLRDAGLLTFESKGVYKFKNKDVSRRDNGH